MKPITPEKVEDSSGETCFVHPAFGFICVSRTRGGDPNLFMSNVKHDGKVTISIGTAKMERAYHNDRHYTDKELIQIEMSTVQFADMMAGMNTASGVPCTLRRVQYERGKCVLVPGIDMESSVSRYSKEMKNKFKTTGDSLIALSNAVRKELEEAKVSKIKQENILAPIESLATEIGANLPFMADMFRESVEGLVQEAKAVVETYAADKGLDSGEVPLLLGKTATE
jgi:hypothetical protein